jgi:SAM-dependent methyltransferase
VSNPYRRAVFDHLSRLLARRGRYPRALDFGSGDGWIAQQLMARGAADELVAVDVQRRRREVITPTLYDGRRLPFADRAFDLVYAVDVLHHCPEPTAALREMLRVCRGDVLLKDHSYRNRRQWLLLAVLDEIGNRRFGVPSRYRYQREWEWLPVLAEQGFRQLVLEHPLVCDPRLPWVAPVQFVGMWSRS